jgi:hypothetical protein
MYLDLLPSPQVEILTCQYHVNIFHLVQGLGKTMRIDSGALGGTRVGRMIMIINQWGLEAPWRNKQPCISITTSSGNR